MRLLRGVLFSLILAAGCETARPVPPLEERVRDARLGPILLWEVSPPEIILGRDGTSYLKLQWGPEGESSISYCDRLFRLVFETTKAFRDAGAKAHASLSIWQAREASFQRFLDDQIRTRGETLLDYHLNQTRAFDVQPAIYGRPFQERMQFLVQHRVMLDALPWVPLAPEEKGISRREVLERWFVDPSGFRGLSVYLDVRRLDFRAEGGRLLATFQADFTVRDAVTKQIIGRHRVDLIAKTEGGVEKTPQGAVKIQLPRGEDPVRLVIQAAARELLESLLPAAPPSERRR